MRRVQVAVPGRVPSAALKRRAGGAEPPSPPVAGVPAAFRLARPGPGAFSEGAGGRVSPATKNPADLRRAGFVRQARNLGRRYSICGV